MADPDASSLSSPTDGSAGDSSSESYQNGAGGGYGAGTDGRRQYENRRNATLTRSAGSVDSRRHSRFSVLQAVRHVFSLDYEIARSEDDDDLAGGFVGSTQHDDLVRVTRNAYPDEISTDWQSNLMKCRFLGIAVLLVLLFVTVTATAKNRIMDSGAYTGDSETDICTDPIQSLRSQSTIEHLSEAAVAADHPLCSKIGTAIMRDHGGNAVDAAVAVALCLGVTNPASSGIGGGGFMLIHVDKRKVDGARDDSMPEFIDARAANESALTATTGKATEVIDCREIAPAKASTNMYTGLPKTSSTLGGLAIGVPGELKCLELAHARHGRLEWATLVEPAMKLARDGVLINGNLAEEIRIMAELYTKAEANGESMPDFGLRDLLTKRDSWQFPHLEGETLKNGKLGDLLEAVMNEGASALYKGVRADKLATEVQDAGGIITKDDIERFRATVRDPVYATDIDGFAMVGVGPPSSGGAAVIGAARFLAGYGNPFASFADTLSMHRLVEGCKHVFAIRMSLSDPAYDTTEVEDAVTDLTRGTFMQNLRSRTRDNTTLPLSRYGGVKWAQLQDSDGNGTASDAHEGDRDRRDLLRSFGYLNDHGTSHFSIVDQDGNAVAMTTSVNTYFGSNVVSKSSGIVLNNQMDDFASPGTPDFFGVKPSEANFIQPGKKPLSSMSPTLLFRSGDTGHADLRELRMVVGASGGPKIITAVLQVIINHVFMGMPLFEAVIHPRLHEQLIYHGAAVLAAEKSRLLDGPVIDVSKRTRDALTKRNQKLLDIDYVGTVQAVSVDSETGELAAACDVRKGGSPDGF